MCSISQDRTRALDHLTHFPPSLIHAGVGPDDLSDIRAILADGGSNTNVSVSVLSLNLLKSWLVTPMDLVGDAAGGSFFDLDLNFGILEKFGKDILALLLIMFGPGEADFAQRVCRCAPGAQYTHPPPAGELPTHRTGRDTHSSHRGWLCPARCDSTIYHPASSPHPLAIARTASSSSSSSTTTSAASGRPRAAWSWRCCSCPRSLTTSSSMLSRTCTKTLSGCASACCPGALRLYTRAQSSRVARRASRSSLEALRPDTPDTPPRRTDSPPPASPPPPSFSSPAELSALYAHEAKMDRTQLHIPLPGEGDPEMAKQLHKVSSRVIAAAKRNLPGIDQLVNLTARAATAAPGFAPLLLISW